MKSASPAASKDVCNSVVPKEHCIRPRYGNNKGVDGKFTLDCLDDENDRHARP